MPTNRIDKVNSLLEHEISQIILRDFDFTGSLVTLTRVQTTANLIEARVYISCLPENKIEKVLEGLRKEIFGIQQKINKKLKMRPIPKIIFVKDDTASKAGKIEKILKEEQEKKQLKIMEK